MPSGRNYGQALKTAVENGQMSIAVLNEHVRRILVTMFRRCLFDKPQPVNWNASVRSPEHALFSRKVAGQGTVLLKNEHHILPLAGTGSIAVIGADGGTKPLAEGGGSSHVVAPYVVSPVNGIRNRAGKGVQVSYADGHDLTQAAKVARAASGAESEGADRPNLELPGDQDRLISVMARANPNAIVVLNTGGAVLMPWINQVRAVVEAWYPGQEDGNAIAAILFGDVDSAGKLTVTFPLTETGVPTGTFQQWPGVRGTSVYSEKLNVGYRWYDATGIQPLFPLGCGLSYATFNLSHLIVTPAKLEAMAGRLTQSVRVRAMVTNVGHRAGAEVAQAYVEQPAKNGEPPRRLRAFAKVFLSPGQAKSVTLVLSPRSFSIYDTAVHL
jgi:beta-glucosidase